MSVESSGGRVGGGGVSCVRSVREAACRVEFEFEHRTGRRNS